MSTRDFIHEIFTACYDSPLCGIPVIRRLNPTSVNIRVLVTEDRFIDVFFNEHTGRIAFALIEDGQRVFGADNTGGWHIHPFDDPQTHEPVNSPVLFAEFIQMIE